MINHTSYLELFKCKNMIKIKIKKIFDNRYSTKDNSKGTRLFVVKNLVESYNKNITVVTSTKNVETKFIINFKNTES